MPDRVHHQVQRHARAVGEKLSAGGDCGFQSLELGRQLFPAGLVQGQVLLQGTGCVVKQGVCVNGVQRVQFLAQETLYPGNVIFQYPRVFGSGRERLQRFRKMLAYRFRELAVGRAVGRNQVKRILVTNRRSVTVGIEQGRQHGAGRLRGMPGRGRFAIVKTAQEVDDVLVAIGLRSGHLGCVLLVFGYRFHRVGPPRNKCRLNGEMVQRLVHASQPLVDAHLHANRRHHVVTRRVRIVIENSERQG